jgi:hypothetical protein
MYRGDDARLLVVRLTVKDKSVNATGRSIDAGEGSFSVRALTAEAASD